MGRGHPRYFSPGPRDYYHYEEPENNTDYFENNYKNKFNIWFPGMVIPEPWAKITGMTSAHSPTLGMMFFWFKNFFEKFMKISDFLHAERLECNFSILFRFDITYRIYLSIIMFIENKHRLSFIDI